MKDFDIWNTEKKNLEEVGHDSLIFHEREIWWCSIGLNLGHEQDGKNERFERPVLILKKFNNKVAWVLPMSTQLKTGKYYYSIEHDGREFSIILSQLRLASTKRFRRFVRKISPHQFTEIQDRIIALVRGI
ncbi:MAG TPA: type II toxin-antitoxin system PemK/MazF family toxin [Candidatus Paceibacterota bacterium]